MTLDPYTAEAVAAADAAIVPAVRAKGHKATKTDKLIAMAAQDDSPAEAEVARTKLQLAGVSGTDPHEMVAYAFRALEQANGVVAIKQVRDGASAIREFIRDRGLGLDVENEASVVVLAAERRAGIELVRMADAGELATQGSGTLFRDLGDDDPKVPLKASDLGLTTDQRKDWQRLAKLDDVQFAELVHVKRESGERLARVDFLREVARLFPTRRPEVVPPPVPPAEPRGRVAPEPEPEPIPEAPLPKVHSVAWARWDAIVDKAEELQLLFDEGWVPEGRAAKDTQAEVNAVGKTLLTMQRMAGPVA